MTPHSKTRTSNARSQPVKTLVLVMTPPGGPWTLQVAFRWGETGGDATARPRSARGRLRWRHRSMNMSAAAAAGGDHLEGGQCGEVEHTDNVREAGRPAAVAAAEGEGRHLVRPFPRGLLSHPARS